MKTVSGQCVSVKDISLSKAAKILSNFVSADNGASHVINAYLHRASASFIELNQLHKELELPHTHKKKHKRERTETGGDSGREVEYSVGSVDINQELSHGHVKSNGFRKHQVCSGNDDEKSARTNVKLSQEPNGSIGHETQNVGGSEKQMKKKKKQEVESQHDGDNIVKFGKRERDGKLPNGALNAMESGREHDNEGDVYPGMGDGKKQKSAKKKHKVSTSTFSNINGEAENVEGENGKKLEQQKVRK